jgi:geranylgeranyl diphosphate synthase type II
MRDTSVMDFKEKYNEFLNKVNTALDGIMMTRTGPGSVIYEAMKYSVAAGGKRLRPVLSLAVCELLGGDPDDVLTFACAIELIHTYSLIHDDLPAMDNDDFRRGMPTSHKVFGEAAAILAGDALLNKAFELMISHIVRKGSDTGNYAKAMEIIAQSSGAEGMILGQMIDIESEGKKVSKETLEQMHRCKTGAIIQASVLSAASICRAAPDEYESLGRYARNIGLAFQIKDDIMDVKGDPEQMGKTLGKDAASEKSTYVTLYGLDRAEEMLDQVISEAVGSLACFDSRAGFLKELALFIKDRDN